jgi:hypothetical protein
LRDREPPAHLVLLPRHGFVGQAGEGAGSRPTIGSWPGRASECSTYTRLMAAPKDRERVVADSLRRADRPRARSIRPSDAKGVAGRVAGGGSARTKSVRSVQPGPKGRSTAKGRPGVQAGRVGSSRKTPATRGGGTADRPKPPGSRAAQTFRAQSPETREHRVRERPTSQQPAANGRRTGPVRGTRGSTSRVLGRADEPRGGPRSARSEPSRRTSREPSRSSRLDTRAGGPTRASLAGRDPLAVGKRWGGVARRGAFQVTRSPGDMKKDRPEWGASLTPPPPMDLWVRSETSSSTKMGPTRSRETPISRVPRTRPLPPAVAAAITKASPSPREREYLFRRAEQAIAAYEAGRFLEALRLAKSVIQTVPTAELLIRAAGLAAYRLGRWREACRLLEGYRSATGDVEELPNLMDCYRALGRTTKVAELWSSLRHVSPRPEVLAEARIVAAGALADRGDLGGAISLLTSGVTTRTLRNPADRHIRQWYALADLYERVGDIPRARELFGRIARADPGAYDAQARLESLGPSRPLRPPKAKRRAKADLTS